MHYSLRRSFGCIAFTALLLQPLSVFGATITTISPFPDVRSGTPEAAATGLLFAEGIVRGYADGMFVTGRRMNRAEFVTMVARFQSSLIGPWDGAEDVSCFPDVPADAWFARGVCHYAALGLLSGNADGLFHPERSISYGEALKILTFAFPYDIVPVPGAHWAEPFYRAAAARGTDLPVRITLDDPLNRGRAARLFAAFIAESVGQLASYRKAEAGERDGVPLPVTPPPASSSASSASSAMTSSVASSTASSEPFLSFETPRSQYLLLGEAGPLIAAASIFLQEEPLDVTVIRVNLAASVSGLERLILYREDGSSLGAARIDPSVSGGRGYRLSLPPGTFTVDRRQQIVLSVRPVLLSKDYGALPGQTLAVGNIVVEGHGVWSSQTYTKATTEAFPSFMTARATITDVSSALTDTAPLVAGAGQRIGSFRFEGRRSDSAAHIDLTDLTFSVGETGGVSLANVRLRADGLSTSTDCLLLSATTIQCSDIPDLYGALEERPRVLELFADVTIADPLHASLQLVLNEPGDILTPGAVSWTDGSVSYDWVALDPPLAAGTVYRR